MKKVTKLTPELKKAGIIELSFYDDTQDVWICLVDPHKVAVDHLAYQREHDDNHSTKMAGIDLPVWPYPICGVTDDRLTLDVYDGQHRIQTAVKKKKNRIRVMVKFGLTPEQRANLYAELQTAKRPPLWNVFKARLSSGNSEFVKMAKIAKANKLTLKCHERNADLRCVDPMVEANRSNIFETWAKLMATFKDGEGRLQKRASVGAIEFQRGLIDLIRKHGSEKVLTNRVIKIFTECGAAFFDEQAAEICHCSRTNRSHFAQAFEGVLVMRGVFKTAA